MPYSFENILVISVRNFSTNSLWPVMDSNSSQMDWYLEKVNFFRKKINVFFDLIQRKSTALHYAAKSESDGPEKLRLLLEKSAKVDIQDKVRYTFRWVNTTVPSEWLKTASWQNIQYRLNHIVTSHRSWPAVNKLVVENLQALYCFFLAREQL